MRTTKQQFIKAFLRSMRESYPSLTEATVTLELEKLLKGEKPRNVIGMFMERAIQDEQIKFID